MSEHTAENDAPCQHDGREHCPYRTPDCDRLTRIGSTEASAR